MEARSLLENSSFGNVRVRKESELAASWAELGETYHRMRPLAASAFRIAGFLGVLPSFGLCKIREFASDAAPTGCR